MIKIQILLSYLLKYDKNTNIIIGGGAVVSIRCNPNILKILDYFTGVKVLWGTDGSVVAFDDIIGKFDILGTRNIYIYDKYKNDYNIHYVPCASCMYKKFKTYNSSKCQITPEGTILYGAKNKKSRKFTTEMMEQYTLVTNRGTDLLCKIDELKKHKTIITNSYHGYYWSLLLGKIPNVDAIQYPSLFDNEDYNEDYIEDHKERADYVRDFIIHKMVPDKFYLEFKTYGLVYEPTKQSILVDCRNRNIEFHKIVNDLFTVNGQKNELNLNEI